MRLCIGLDLNFLVHANKIKKKQQKNEKLVSAEYRTKALTYKAAVKLSTGIKLLPMGSLF